MSGVDLTSWVFFWEFNKDPYLALKAHVHRDEPSTGDETWFLGEGTRRQRVDILKPTVAQIRDEVVPALLSALESETNNDVVTGSLIALAKIGDLDQEDGRSRRLDVFRRFLTDRNQEIGETAALAMGILGHPDGASVLAALLAGGSAGRALVADAEVDFRTRAFAAYALGLIGAQSPDEALRLGIVHSLEQALSAPDLRRDVAVACVSAMGLVPLSTIGDPAAQDESARGPSSTRCGQIAGLLSLLEDDEQDHVVRAHCPTALVRLLADVPPPARADLGRRVLRSLTGRLDARREQQEVTQSAVLALGGLAGVLGDATEPLARIERALRSAGDLQTRLFALVALARAGAAPGVTDPERVSETVRKVLLAQLGGTRGNVRAWAALACGILGRELLDQGRSEGVAELQRAVRLTFDDETDPQQVGAHAIALGLLGDVESSARVLERLLGSSSDEARGAIAIGLGLMNARSALEPIRSVLAASRYRPELLKHTAVALGLLGDKSVVPELVHLLRGARGLAVQAALSAALGFIGDRGAIEPLIGLLRDPEVTAAARGLAAAALGMVADAGALPWNSGYALGINYRASTETLTSPSGRGILDIL